MICFPCMISTERMFCRTAFCIPTIPRLNDLFFIVFELQILRLLFSVTILTPIFLVHFLSAVPNSNLRLIKFLNIYR